MIPAKIEPGSIAPSSELGVESILDWFDEHKQSFYLLACAYFKNEKQIEEVFYQAILKVHKQYSQLNKETSFETGVTAIFLQICRELSSDGSLRVSEENEHQHELLRALHQLKENEKDAVTLTFVKGMSREDASQLLKVSEEKLKEDSFSGIQALKKAMGHELSCNGCREYHTYYIDYLERTLDRPAKIDFEKHIYHCGNCQEDLASFQDVMFTLIDFNENFHAPASIIENVKARLTGREKQRKQKNKKWIRTGLIFASIFILLIGLQFFTGFFTNYYYAYTEKDPELRSFLQNGQGKMLNLEAESNGIKVRIKSAIADDVQTLIFYEIEDKEDNIHHVIDSFNGVDVKNRLELMGGEEHGMFIRPDFQKEFHPKKGKNVYKGKMNLQPIIKDKGVIDVNISKLLKVIHSPADQPLNYDNIQEQRGKWNFEIPVTKHSSVEYALKGETTIEGVTLRFDKLTIAPTTTVLQYAINQQPEKWVQFVNFGDLKVNNKTVKTYQNGGGFVESHSDSSWNSFLVHYEPISEEEPKEVKVNLDSAHLSITDNKVVDLDAKIQYPQTFEYAGSKISIDKFEIGKTPKVILSNHDVKNRAYERLQLGLIDQDGIEVNAMMDSQGVFVDRNGVEHDPHDRAFTFEELDMPRYFNKVDTITVDTLNSTVKRIPKSIRIQGYETTKFLDDVVKVSVKPREKKMGNE